MNSLLHVCHRGCGHAPIATTLYPPYCLYVCFCCCLLQEHSIKCLTSLHPSSPPTGRSAHVQRSVHKTAQVPNHLRAKHLLLCPLPPICLPCLTSQKTCFKRTKYLLQEHSINVVALLAPCLILIGKQFLQHTKPHPLYPMTIKYKK